MKLIDSNYKPIQDINDYDDGWFWTYNIEKKDFFMDMAFTWHTHHAPAYEIEIANKVLHIPANMFIIIGDYDGGLDTVCPNEICGRRFEVLCVSSDFEPESWTLEPITIVGYKENYAVNLPHSSNLFPVSIGDGKAIVVAPYDCYNKVKLLSFCDFV